MHSLWEFLAHNICSFFDARLLERGYTIDQIADGTIAAEQARQERYQSNTSQKWDKMNEISERFGRVLRKALPGNGQKMTVAANSA